MTKPVNKTCHRCGKTFKRRENLVYHLDKAPNCTPGLSPNNLEEQNYQLHKELEDMKAQNDKLCKELEKVSTMSRTPKVVVNITPSP